jgi:hypothetical protein
MAVQQTVGLHEGDGGQTAAVNGGEEIRCVLGVSGPLRLVAIIALV